MLPALKAGGVDAVVTDPPYGLEFMGKEWDHGVPGIEFWKAIAAGCNPGCHCFAFGGTRAFHRLAVAIEDAGWKIRDCLSWLYGSGFPKSLDVGKAIDKAAGAKRRRVVNPRWATRYPNGPGGVSGNPLEMTLPATSVAKQWIGFGTALKPGWEPILLARKPLEGTVAQNALRYGCGALGVDECRIGTEVETWPNSRSYAAGRMALSGRGHGNARTQGTGTMSPGRWPTNVVLSEEAAEELDLENKISPQKPGRVGRRGGCGFGMFDDEKSAAATGVWPTDHGGGVSRFFYVAKASQRERGQYNSHPTVKPLKLMEWLCKLACPPGGLVIDPFAGSGSTGLACLQTGRRFIGVELDAGYAKIAVKRLKQAEAETRQLQRSA